LKFSNLDWDCKLKLKSMFFGVMQYAATWERAAPPYNLAAFI
jgi:hypothetical protein